MMLKLVGTVFHQFYEFEEKRKYSGKIYYGFGCRNNEQPMHII